MESNKLRSIVTDCYSARMAGDSARLHELFAEHARFHVIGAKHLIEDYPGSQHSAMRAATDGIMRLVEMRSAEPAAILIDGNRAAVRLRATVSFGGREPFETELGHWWEFDEAGKVVSVTEFVDTAKLREEMAALQ